MKKLWLPVLLGISLIANGFFVGGAFYAKQAAHARFGPPDFGRQNLAWRRGAGDNNEGRRDGPAARLGLSDAQREAFAEMGGSVRSRARVYRDEVQPRLQQFREEANSDTPDAAEIASLLREIADGRRAMQVDVIGEAEAFMTQLDAEQLQKFIRSARRLPMFRLLGLGMPPGRARTGSRGSGGGPGGPRFR